MSLQVIGAGLGRTGTASIKVALEQLGIGRCYHMGEVMGNLADAAGWIAAAEGKPAWDALLRDYRSVVDYPACSFWRDLLGHYPSAKVLLSTRDASGWFDSVYETILSPEFVGWVRQSPLKDFFDNCVWADYRAHIHDRDFMVAYYERRSEEITRVVPAEQLLVYEVRQGWAPLCEFLGLAVPEADFPRVNSRAETAQIIQAIMTGPGDISLAENMRGQRSKLFGDG